MPEKKRPKVRRNSDIRLGDMVEVVRDIQRIPNPTTADEREKFKKDRWNHYFDTEVHRKAVAPQRHVVHQPYAKAGERGEVLGFVVWNENGPHATIREPQPQVRMTTGEIKTFRATSLKHVEGSKKQP